MKNFLNLTNGIEYLPDVSADGFVRIQSTRCEQKRWWPIILDLDYTFLLAAALDEVTIYDTSQNKKVPRALYQGVEWIKYTLSRRWLDIETRPIVKGCNCLQYFRDCYNSGDERKPALNKLDYVRKLAIPTKVNIKTVSRQTSLDGKYDKYSYILIRFF